MSRTKARKLLNMRRAATCPAGMASSTSGDATFPIAARQPAAARNAPVDRNACTEQSGEIRAVAADQIKLSDRNVGHGLDGPQLDRARVGLAAVEIRDHRELRPQLLDGLVARPAEPGLFAVRTQRQMADRLEHVRRRRPRHEGGPAALRDRVLVGAPRRDGTGVGARTESISVRRTPSNLDAALRAQMRIEIKRIHQRLRTTIIYVTHDQVEAMTLADKIVVMNGGHIEQVGGPLTLYRRPVSRFVAGFIGSPKMNFFPAKLFAAETGLHADLGDGIRIEMPRERDAAYRPYAGRSVEIGIRPEHLLDDARLINSGAIAMDVTIDVVEPLGSTSLITFVLGGTSYTAIGDIALMRRPGQPKVRLTGGGEGHLSDRSVERQRWFIRPRPDSTPLSGLAV